jgi:hypothetical protein
VLVLDRKDLEIKKRTENERRKSLYKAQGVRMPRCGGPKIPLIKPTRGAI